MHEAHEDVVICCHKALMTGAGGGEHRRKGSENPPSILKELSTFFIESSEQTHML